MLRGHAARRHSDINCEHSPPGWWTPAAELSGVSVRPTSDLYTTMESVLDKGNAAVAEINRSLTDQDKIGFLRDMCRIRWFERISLQQYQASKMGGFLHLYSGQEAVAVGTISLIGENDHIITAYRDHGHALAVGMSMNECMAELFGKQTGCSKGKGGSMHFFAPDKNYWGGHGIVGGQTPLGLGIAYGLKYKGLTGCCLCYLGDGAINQGPFHESLNLAALWDLPVIYIIENNGYSMGTSQKRSSAYKNNLAERAEGYNMAWDVFSGENVLEVRARTWEAIQRAHTESKPSILEIQTYRHYGHSVADANASKYRTPDEIEKYKQQHDPIQIFRRQLAEEGLLDDASFQKIDKEARKEAEASVKFAEESPFPDPREIFDDIYSEVDNKTDAGRTGKHFFND